MEYRDKMGSVCLWCLHCEKTVYNPKRLKGGWLECPHCGAGHYDLWGWDEVRRANPQYPENPEDGKRYPMYPLKAVVVELAARRRK